MQLSGYESAPRDHQLTQEQQDWFTKMEDELNKPIHVVYGGLFTKQRGDSFDETGVITIFDGASSIPIGTGQGLTSTEQMVFYRPATGNAGEGDNRRTFQLPMRVSRCIAAPAMDQRAVIVSSVPDGVPRYTHLAVVDVGTIWSRVFLANFKAFNQGERFLRSTDSVMDIVVKPMLIRCLEKEALEKIHDERRDAARNQFIEAARRHATTRSSELLREIETQEAQLISLERNALNAFQHMRRAQKEYDFCQEDSDLSDETLMQEYNTLMQHSHLTDLTYLEQSHQLSMTTDNLYLYSPDRQERTPAGKFTININFENNELRVTNLTNMCGGRMHPHIPGNGQPCFGPMASAIQEAVQKKEMHALFCTMIDYLQSYNPADDWGRWAANWWLPQEDTVQEWLQTDGSWLTKKQIEEAAPTREAEPVEGEESVDDELTRAIASEIDEQTLVTTGS